MRLTKQELFTVWFFTEKVYNPALDVQKEKRTSKIWISALRTSRTYCSHKNKTKEQSPIKIGGNQETGSDSLI